MATINSNNTGGGNWHVGTTWEGGVVPSATDRVVIKAGDTVVIDDNTTIGDSPSQTTFVVDIYGTLKWADSPGGSWVFNSNGSIRIRPTGTLQIGSDAYPIPADKTATLQFGAGTCWLIQMDSTVGTVQRGRIQIRGAVAYHMASAEMTKARLSANVSSGTGVSLRFDRDVDWEVGDVVFLGRGGSLTTAVVDSSGNFIAGYGTERVTLLSKVSAHEFTAHLMYNHLAGDIAAHGTRNVAIVGNSTTGFCIYKATPGLQSGGYTTHGWIDLSWATLRYAGGSGSYPHGVYIQDGGQYASNDILAGQYLLKSCVFDSPSSNASTSAALAFTNCFRMKQLAEDIDDLVIWGFYYGIAFGGVGSTYARGIYTLGRVAVIGYTYNAVYLTMDTTLQTASLWISCGGNPTTPGIDTLGCGFRCREFLSHGAYTAADLTGYSGVYTRLSEVYILSGEVLNCKRYGVRLSDEHRVVIKNTMFRFGYDYLLDLDTSCGGVFCDSCTFDGKLGSGSGGGTVFLPRMATNGEPKDARFTNCKFGTSIRNTFSNLVLYQSGGAVSNGAFGRVVVENCEFKEPIFTTEPTWGLWGKWRGVIVWSEGAATCYDMIQAPGYTLEIINPIVRDAAGADQWAATYPGVTHMAIFGGGGEWRNESAVVVDGSYAAKITPWNPWAANCGSFYVPYRIPVRSGDTLTVKIKLRKTFSQPDELKRPTAFLSGCGIYAEATMSDVNDVWNEVTLSGVSNANGLVDFWVSPGWGASYNGVLVRDPWYQTVYADGISVTIS